MRRPDYVLVCSPFQAKFHGPFSILRKVSEQNYLLSTPKRKKSTQLCHVNLLKPYYSRESPFCERVPQQTVKPVLVTDTVGRHSPAAEMSVQVEDGVVSPDESRLRGRLRILSHYVI